MHRQPRAPIGNRLLRRRGSLREFPSWAQRILDSGNASNGREGERENNDSSLNIVRCGFALSAALSGSPFGRMRLQKDLGGVILETLPTLHVGAQHIE